MPGVGLKNELYNPLTRGSRLVALLPTMGASLNILALVLACRSTTLALE